MPEAVASNSIPMPERQPFHQLPSYIQRDFDELQSMLIAFKAMSLCVLDTGENYSGATDGMGAIHKLIMKEMDDWAHHAEMAIKEVSQSGKIDFENDRDLLHRVGDIVAAVYCDAGWSMSKDDMGAWGIEETRTYSGDTAKYYRLLIEKLEGDDSRITAGSWLPWLEMKIRKDIGVIPAEREPEPLSAKSLRDQIVAEKYREGRSPSEISQALSLRQSTVLRIIDRLKGTVEVSDRKAI